jgi:hypothetical protein
MAVEEADVVKAADPSEMPVLSKKLFQVIVICRGRNLSE